jgi:hypothetical protein
MEKKLALVLAFWAVNGWGDATVSHDQPYFTRDGEGFQIISTQKNKEFANKTLSLEPPLHRLYEKQYGFKLDERLYVGLISDYNQIANGFSTPLPNVRQINYIGGTELVDSFCVRSWLETLLYHETAHNYQLNAKDNPVSRSLHTVLGNGFLFLPFFTHPNIAVNSFLLEGNAVLNESWHGNGGRLYSGRFKAQTLLQAKAGYLTPERMHNHTLFFPYGEHHYIQGGFFQYFLAEKYGIEKTNRFFKKNSWDWYWPFKTNDAMERTFGRRFDSLLDKFAQKTLAESQNLVEVEGPVLARSAFFDFLNKDKDEIVFLTSPESVRGPELVRYSLADRQIARERSAFLSGKVIKAEGNYFTQAGNFVNPFRVYQGLFDRNAVIKPGTQSKMIQGYLSNGSPVYFDVPTSFDHPRLFVGDSFYGDVHSSVFIDSNDNLYYFTQEGKTRTLFRNKTALYSYSGFYGIVCDVDTAGSVYFVANSPWGSSLFRFTKSAAVERVHKADNIVDARLVSDRDALVAAVGADDYYYAVTPLTPDRQSNHNTVLYFENDPLYGSLPANATAVSLDLDKPYHALTDMHYSGIDLSFGQDEEIGWVYNVSVNFGDPLGQNALSVLASRTPDEVSLAGVSYQNTQTFIRFNGVGYGVTETPENESSTNYRRSGVAAQASVPWLQRGYWMGNLDLTFQQDYLSYEREPLGLDFNIGQRKRFGLSLYDNSASYADVFAVWDRGDQTVGGTLSGQTDFPREWYLSVGAKGSFNDRDKRLTGERRGVKIQPEATLFDYDPSLISMGSLRDSVYVKSAVKGGATVRKVLNHSLYYFTFPVSLRREGLYAAYNAYGIDDFQETRVINEYTAGVQLDLLILNSFQLPLNLEYIHSDNDKLTYADRFRVFVDLTF